MTYAVPMLESEAGWGRKVDGYAGPFDTLEEAQAFQTAYNKKWNDEPETPEWYITALDPVEYAWQKCEYGTSVGTQT